ncbi:hypothetical protein F8C76_16265 [Flagellimonas olearia]|uniref:Uncharacterized protein n=1 Tax=Flagellimonas olearia TaxID=552546 RepID=A0A6I1DW71_9FLAO|nr:hypothetical protein [Allomuricauda olearia]KAB7529378.1 hypothetical protein F8C76_16265 [Allomuricauda olearia]
MKNATTPITPNSFIKTLSFLHMGIMAGPVILGIFFYTQVQNSHLDFSDSGDAFLAIIPLIAITGIFLGGFIFNKMIRSIPKDLDLRQKLARFQTASIIKYAFLEGPALFGIVIFHNTQNLAYLIIAAFLIFYLFLQRPTRDKVERHLDLRGEEKSKFNRYDQPLGE